MRLTKMSFSPHRTRIPVFGPMARRTHMGTRRSRTQDVTDTSRAFDLHVRAPIGRGRQRIVAERHLRMFRRHYNAGPTDWRGDASVDGSGYREQMQPISQSVPQRNAIKRYIGFRYHVSLRYQSMLVRSKTYFLGTKNSPFFIM